MKRPKKNLINTHANEHYFGFIYHYYRAEVYRETNWRNRLDVTTNWSIVVTAAILSFAFTQESVPHTVILINFVMVWFFLYVESRRFRYFSLLRERTRLLEHNLLGPIFSGEQINLTKIAPWKQELIKSLRQPEVKMSRLESIAWRLRRNYLMLFPVLFLAWLTKLQLLPIHGKNIFEIFNSAQVWFIPGWLVFGLFLMSEIITLTIAFYIPQTSHDDDLP